LPPIVKIEGKGAFPLSLQQERYWNLPEPERSHPGYNVALAFQVFGSIDIPALRSALSGLLQRHDILRVRFSEVAGKVYQVIEPDCSGHLDIHQLRVTAGCPADSEDPQSDLVQLLGRLSDTPFDILRGPLFRAALVLSEPNSNALLVACHHIIADAISLNIILEDLFAYYSAEATGTEANLPDIALRYVDYACWQRQLLHHDIEGATTSYWQRKLADPPEPLAFPVGRHLVQPASMRGGSVPFRLSENTVAQIHEFCRQQRLMASTALLSAFKLLLFHYCDTNDILIGSPFANRTRPEVQRMAGLFSNLLLLRTDLGGNPSFLELTRRVSHTVVDAYDHQLFPLSYLLGRGSAAGRAKVSLRFSAAFNFLDAEQAGNELPGLTVEPLWLPCNSATVDINLVVACSPSWIEGAIEYDSDKFELPAIEQMVSSFIAMLRFASTFPDTKIAEFKNLLDGRGK
jgi:hypothetical protein